MKAPSQIALFALAVLNVPLLVQGRAIPAVESAEQASALMVKRDAPLFRLGAAVANLLERATTTAGSSSPKAGTSSPKRPGSAQSGESTDSWMSSSDGLPEPEPAHVYISGSPPTQRVPPPADAPTAQELTNDPVLRENLLKQDGIKSGRDGRGVAFSKVSIDRVNQIVQNPDRFVLWSSPASGEGATSLIQNENNPMYAGKNVLWFYRPGLFTEGFAEQSGAKTYEWLSIARQSSALVKASTAKDVDLHVAYADDESAPDPWAPAGQQDTGLGKTFRGIERGLLPNTPMERMWMVNQMDPNADPVLAWLAPGLSPPAGYKGPAPDQRPRNDPSWGPTYPVDTDAIAVPDYPVE